MKTLQVWDNGGFREVEIGQRALVFSVGGGRRYFGEFATLERSTKQHLVFKTESGETVKTKIDNINEVVGKANKNGYAVSLNVEGREEDSNFSERPVRIY